MRASRTQSYKSFEPTIDYETDEDTGKLFIQLLKLAGFVKDGEGNYVPLMPEAITRLLQMQGGFNALMKMGCFPARVINNMAKGVMYNPTIEPIGKIYSLCAAELGESECYGSDGKHKPEWLLRKLITNKWATSTCCTESEVKQLDWRVQGLASVMINKFFSIKTKYITSRVDGVPVAKRMMIAITFTWQGRYRKKPGATHPRILFKSL